MVGSDDDPVAPLPTVARVAGAERLAGLMGTWPDSDVDEGFWARLVEVDPSLTTATGAAAAYDAVVIAGLAAEIARSDAPSKLAAEVAGVTTEGTKCGTYATCRVLTDAMSSIDYDGQSGAIELRPDGDPGEASFAVGRIDDEGGLEKLSVRTAAVPPANAAPAPGAELNPFAGPPADGKLVVGTVMPESGPLAEEAKAQRAAVRLAVDDVNAAGGVLGEPVELLEGDAGPDAGATARASVADQLARGVDVVIGPPGPSGVASILDDVTHAGVVLFGPTASGVPTDAPDRGLFFRMSPSDTLQGDALADVVTGEGVLEVTAVIPVGGSPAAPALVAGLERSGASIVGTVLFDPADPGAATTIEAVRTASGGGIVFLGDEGPLAQLFASLVGAGASPDEQRWFTAHLSPRLGDAG